MATAESFWGCTQSQVPACFDLTSSSHALCAMHWAKASEGSEEGDDAVHTCMHAERMSGCVIKGGKGTSLLHRHTIGR